MKKTKAIFAAVAFITGTLGFSIDSDNEKFEFHITFDELKEAFQGNAEKKDDLKIPKTDSAVEKKSDSETIDIENLKKFAEAGNPSFQFALGRCYARGEGIEQSWEQAIHWYTLSAEQGDRRAQNNLGCIYYDEDEALRDYEKAIYWLQKSADQNFAFALLNLGEMYRNGYGFPQDYKKAMDYYKKAEKIGAREAFYCIGYMYKNGLGVSKSDKKARKNFKKAADLGYQRAKDELEN